MTPPRGREPQVENHWSNQFSYITHQKQEKVESLRKFLLLSHEEFYGRRKFVFDYEEIAQHRCGRRASLETQYHGSYYKVQEQLAAAPRLSSVGTDNINSRCGVPLLPLLRCPRATFVKLHVDTQPPALEKPIISMHGHVMSEKQALTSSVL